MGAYLTYDDMYQEWLQKKGASFAHFAAESAFSCDRLECEHQITLEDGVDARESDVVLCAECQAEDKEG